MFNQAEQAALDNQIIPPGRVALGVEYMGGNYSGWQRQAHVPSIQQYIEQCLEKILRHKVDVVCAGRTDAGVSATSQIIHFDSQVARPLKAYTRGMNSNLPNDIGITWAKPVPDEFHARYSATARQYRYIIYNNPLRSGILNSGLTHVYQPLIATSMHEAAQVLVGENDFTSFRASHCQSKTPFRNIHSISVEQHMRYIVVQVKANAFLHHMVRNIVGSLIDVGSGEQNVHYLKDLLKLKDRTKASSTAKANGLYLVGVDYPKEFDLPMQDLGPLFLPN